MPEIDLKYGRSSIPVEYDESRFAVLETYDDPHPLSDVELGDKLDSPIESKPLEEIVQPGESILFVVPDATRRTACGQVINLLLRRMIANGTAPHEMAVIFATGIHRAVTDEEKQTILTPFVAQRIKTLDHSPRDLMQIVRFGETRSGIPVELNRAITEYDHVVLIGGASFHYFAGFTGGRKLICPGLASAKTVAATHKLAFDCEKHDRRTGVATASLDGNPVHEAFIEAASFAKPAFAITTIVDDSGEAVDLFCGDWIASHRAACDAYAKQNTIRISEKRDVVVVSCGGWPHDINMIQAHKAFEAASHACTDGGTIVLLAECGEGLGRSDFLNWFFGVDSAELARRLCESYQVNGQTAWSLLTKTERFKVKIVTALRDNEIKPLRMQKIETGSLEEYLTGSSGYILPFGARSMIEI
ncbi:MAG: nickel-dependent lactate racemase [Acidobacteria bacterium]|nr:MAG: nickel-dependent lactate racemase [Acidobacteriota bacterium]